MGALQVAVAVTALDPAGAAAVQYSHGLAAALLAAGVETELWQLDDDTAPGPPDGLPARRIVLPRRRTEREAARVGRGLAALHDAFADHPVDLVHAQDGISAAALAAQVRTVHRVPDPDGAPAVNDRGLRGPAGHVCTVRSLARRLADEWDIAPVVIPPGIAADRFARAADPDDVRARRARRAWQQRLGRYVLVVPAPPVGEASARRDVTAAMRTVQRRVPELRLVHPGDLGGVGAAELPALVAAAAVVVVPAGRDGAGADGAAGLVAALEALAAGVPVVAGFDPALAEVAGRAVRLTASVGDLAEQIELAAGRPDPVRQNRGRAVAAGLPWSAAAATHVRFYTAVLARTAPRGRLTDPSDPPPLAMRPVTSG